MKKKIIFMLINMNVGGTEKSLLNMIAELPSEDFDITILMLEEYGDFLEYIPKWVHVEYVGNYSEIRSILNKPQHKVIYNLIKRGKLIKAISLLFLFLLTKLKGERSLLLKYLLHRYPKINHEYDLAVAYAGPMDLISFFVAEKIKASKKIQWIHFDVTKIGFNSAFASRIYNKFDRIFVVSEEAKVKLLNRVPTVTEKTDVFYNIVSSKQIMTLCEQGIGFSDDFDGLRILTVGRLTKEKGQDLAIRVLARLINEGYKVRWYCIGDGIMKGEYETLLENYKVREHFVFLGVDPNPYPYMRQCDIYVQPSRYEGYCITIMEARCLHKPIVATDVNGVNEQITNDQTGIIVKIDEKAIYDAVKKLINNFDLRMKLTLNLVNQDFMDKPDMEKLTSVFAN